MGLQQSLSRRRLLSGAAGSLIVSGSAFAQTAKRIEQFAPELDAIISTSEPIQELASGTGGTLGPTEGPLWWKEGGYLLYSDIHNNRRMKYVPGQGASVAQEQVNRSNGLTRDLQGRLVACERVTRRVVRFETDGSTTVIAGSFQGKQLNIPNDVIVKSDGAIYFSDPLGIVIEQWDLGFPGVYRVSADLGTMTLLANDFVFPNGLAFSPDESVIYITDFRRGLIRAFDLLPNGTLAKHTDRIFADLRGPEPGGPDGIKVDVAGNVYCGGSGGIYVLDPERQEAWPHRARAPGDDQHCVRRRRLEDALFHELELSWRGQGQNRRGSCASRKENVSLFLSS